MRSLLIIFAVLAWIAAPCSVLIRDGSIDDLYSIDYDDDLRVSSRPADPEGSTSSIQTGSGSWQTGSLGLRSTSTSSLASSSAGPSEPSQVFRAERKKDRRQVIVKRMPKTKTAEALKEAETMVFVDDVATTMRLYDVVVDDDYVYLVMQYFKGRTVWKYFHDMIDDPAVTCQYVVDRIRYVACSVACTLKLFLDRGVAHFDLNCLNVLIDDDNNVVVIDLGMSRALVDLPPTSLTLHLSRLNSFGGAQTRSFRHLLRQLFQIADNRFHDELTAVPLWQQAVVDPQSITLDEFLDQRENRLIGDNAARRYSNFYQRIRMQDVLEAGQVRPVLSDERSTTQLGLIKRGRAEPCASPDRVDTVALVRILSKRARNNQVLDWLTNHVA